MARVSAPCRVLSLLEGAIQGAKVDCWKCCPGLVLGQRRCWFAFPANEIIGGQYGLEAGGWGAGVNDSNTRGVGSGEGTGTGQVLGHAIGAPRREWLAARCRNKG